MERHLKSKNVLFVIELGEHIQRYCPEVAEEYRHSNAQSIANRLVASGGLKFNGAGKITSPSILRNAIRTAIIGNSNPDLGPTYTGLMEKDEYNKLSGEYQRRALVNGRATATKNKSGIRGASHNDLAKYAREAAIARGRTPWQTHEVEDAINLSNHPFFQYPAGHRSSGHIYYAAIAHAINYIHHNGEEIRTNGTVRQAIARNAISEAA